MDITSRAIGCLLGGAFGDSVGASVEFMTRDKIIRQFGEQGIREPLGYPGAGFGSFTDDTQQVIEVIEGILHGRRRGPGHETILEDIWDNLKRWRIQQQSPENNRAPGATSLSALSSKTPGSFDHRLNYSTSCGAVMRAHPIGIYYAGKPEPAFQLGLEVGVLTHGGEEAFVPSGILAAIISLVVNGEPLREAIEKARRLALKSKYRAPETLAYLDLVLSANPADARADLGCGALGWHGPDALAIGLMAALKFPNDLVDACSFAATHDGDSDSTASIAGSIVGAMNGEQSLPYQWHDKIEAASFLRVLASELLNITKRYPYQTRRE